MIQSLLPEETTMACQGASSLMPYMQLHFNTEKTNLPLPVPQEEMCLVFLPNHTLLHGKTNAQ